MGITKMFKSIQAIVLQRTEQSRTDPETDEGTEADGIEQTGGEAHEGGSAEQEAGSEEDGGSESSQSADETHSAETGGGDMATSGVDHFGNNHRRSRFIGTSSGRAILADDVGDDDELLPK